MGLLKSIDASVLQGSTTSAEDVANLVTDSNAQVMAVLNELRPVTINTGANVSSILDKTNDIQATVARIDTNTTPTP